MKQSFQPAWAFITKEEKWLKEMCPGYTLNVCSGHTNIGDVKLDLYEPADIKADMRYLPFKPYCFDYVIWDPPFKFYHNLRQSMRVFYQLTYLTKKRFILVGQQYFIPYAKSFIPKFYWTRYKRMNIRWFCVYDRKDSMLEGYVY